MLTRQADRVDTASWQPRKSCEQLCVTVMVTVTVSARLLSPNTQNKAGYGRYSRIRIKSFLVDLYFTRRLFDLFIFIQLFNGCVVIKMAVRLLQSLFVGVS